MANRDSLDRSWIVTISAAQGHPPESAPDRLSGWRDRKSTRLNSSHLGISYAVFCLKKKLALDAHCRRHHFHRRNQLIRGNAFEYLNVFELRRRRLGSICFFF